MISTYTTQYGAESMPHAMPERRTFFDLLEFAGLDNWVRPGTVTRDQAGSRSTTDIVLAFYSLREQIIECEVHPSVHADSDRLPIRTALEINVPEASDPVKGGAGRLWMWRNSPTLC